MIRIPSWSQPFTLVGNPSCRRQLAEPPPGREASSPTAPQLGGSHSLFFQSSCSLKHLSCLPRVSRAEDRMAEVSLCSSLKLGQLPPGQPTRCRLSCSCPSQQPGPLADPLGWWDPLWCLCCLVLWDREINSESKWSMQMVALKWKIVNRKMRALRKHSTFRCRGRCSLEDVTGVILLPQDLTIAVPLQDTDTPIKKKTNKAA